MTDSPDATTLASLFPVSSRRAEESTYLTYPEWYIVYSSEEYARWIASHPPSGFLYVRSIGQYWCGYNAVFEVTRSQYGFNAGDHLMLVVIGTSYTAEYAIKGVYENTIGRLTESLSDGGQTEEDRFARQVAADYGQFLNQIPWYEYPFGARLSALWRETGTWGPHPIRKWERKLALSAEYAGKAFYGWLIGLATGAVYDADATTMQMWVESVPAARLARDPSTRVERAVDERSQLLTVPRFTAFTELLLRSAPAPGEPPGRVLSVAGNRRLMLTAIAPASWRYDLAAGTPIFEQVVLTEPDKKRVAVGVTVPDLLAVLADLQRAGITVEHVYDY